MYASSALLISSKFTEVGTYLEIHGTAKDSETFGFQVTNTQGHWPVSTPKEGFNIYDSLKEQLMDFGIPGNEIEYIHNANSDKARTELFKKVQKGEIRILIGSTFKLGIGVNVQNKLIAIHHIDVPWRPADMTQREGRILRQGNENEVVTIFRYVTEESFDAYSWQLLESKQNFISKLLSSKALKSFSSNKTEILPPLRSSQPW